MNPCTSTDLLLYTLKTLFLNFFFYQKIQIFTVTMKMNLYFKTFSSESLVCFNTSTDQSQYKKTFIDVVFFFLISVFHILSFTPIQYLFSMICKGVVTRYDFPSDFQTILHLRHRQVEWSGVPTVKLSIHSILT